MSAKNRLQNTGSPATASTSIANTVLDLKNLGSLSKATTTIWSQLVGVREEGFVILIHCQIVCQCTCQHGSEQHS